MPETADNLSELHGLHQRAKAIRDRLVSGPKTLAGREAVLATRKTALEAAQKALRDGRTGYPDNQGEPGLRRAVAEKLARDNGLAYDPDR